MKKVTLFLTLMITVLSTQAQEISNEQWTILTKTSASWCTNCGGTAWDLFKDLIDDNADKNVIVWSSHNSGDLDNEASVDINNGWGSFGQPQFYVNSDLFPANNQSARAEINGYIDALIGFGALAGVGVDATYDGTTLNITGKAEFFTDLEDGSYHLAAYLLKDHVISFQESRGNDADHRYVLTDKITESSFGELIVEGAVEAGATYTIEASKEIADIDLDNDEIVIILWNLRSDGVYAFFNANRNSIQEAGTSSTADISGVSDITLKQNSSEAVIEITTDQNLGNISTRLVNVSGQVMSTQNIRSVTGVNQIRYNTDNLNAGTYLIQITANGSVHTEKVVVL